MHPASLSPLPSVVSHRALLASLDVSLEASVEHRARRVLLTTTNQGRPLHKVSPRERPLGRAEAPAGPSCTAGAAPAKLGCHGQTDHLRMRALVSCPNADKSLGLSEPQRPDRRAAGMMPAPTCEGWVSSCGRGGCIVVSGTWQSFTTTGAPHLLRHQSF